MNKENVAPLQRIKQFLADPKAASTLEVVVTLLVGIVVSILAYGLFEISQSNDTLIEVIQGRYEENASLFWLQIGVIGSFFLLLRSLFNSKWISGAIVLISALVLSIANEQKLSLRSEPLYPADLSMAPMFPSY